MSHLAHDDDDLDEPLMLAGEVTSSPSSSSSSRRSEPLSLASSSLSLSPKTTGFKAGQEQLQQLHGSRTYTIEELAEWSEEFAAQVQREYPHTTESAIVLLALTVMDAGLQDFVWKQPHRNFSQVIQALVKRLVPKKKSTKNMSAMTFGTMAATTGSHHDQVESPHQTGEAGSHHNNGGSSPSRNDEGISSREGKKENISVGGIVSNSTLDMRTRGNDSAYDTSAHKSGVWDKTSIERLPFLNEHDHDHHNDHHDDHHDDDNDMMMIINERFPAIQPSIWHDHDQHDHNHDTNSHNANSTEDMTMKAAKMAAMNTEIFEQLSSTITDVNKGLQPPSNKYVRDPRLRQEDVNPVNFGIPFPEWLPWPFNGSISTPALSIKFFYSRRLVKFINKVAPSCLAVNCNQYM